MSEPRVGEPSKRRKVITTIIGLVVAPVVTCVSLVIGVIIFSMVMGGGGFAYLAPSGNFAILIAAVMYGGTFGLVPSLLVALPLHHYFVRKRWSSAVQNGVLGLVAAILSLSLFLAVLSIWIRGPSPFMYPGAYIAIASLGVAGIPGGLSFWIIRRPDRDSPPIPDEVFA